MSYHIEDQGTYELIYTVADRRVLILDEQPYSLSGGYFTIAEGSQGELTCTEHGDFEKRDTLRQGAYKLVSFRNDPQFQNIPYLFLQKNRHYEEVFLPEGLPDLGTTARYIFTDHTIAGSDLEAYLNDGTDIERIATAETQKPPFDDYFDLTAGDLAERIRQMQPADLQRLEEFEEEHKNRSTVLNTIDQARRNGS